MLKTVKFMSSWMPEMEKRLEEAEEKSARIEARAEVEAKGRMY